MNALWNSLLVAGGATALAVLLGCGVALFWVGSGAGIRRGLEVLAGMTLAMPPFLVANCWLELSAGWRLEWGGERSTTAFLPLTAAVLALMTWPVPALAGMAALGRVERGVLEVMSGMGAKGCIRHVAWPSMCGAVGLAAVVVFCMAAGNFAVPTLFQVRVLPEAMWIRFNTQLDWAGAWMAGLPLVLITVGTLAWVGRKEVRWPWGGGGAVARDWRRGLGRAWWWAGVLVAGVAVVSVGLPLVHLVGNGRTWRELWPALQAGREAVFTSGWVALMGALVLWMSGIGLVLLQGWTRQSGRGRGGLVLGGLRWLSWLWFLVPGILTASLWVPLYAWEGGRGISDSRWAYLPVLLPRYLAIAWTAAALAVDRADPAAWEVLRMGGMGRMEAWCRGIWPQMAGLSLGGAYAVYLLILWDVETVILIQPPGMETLGVRIFNLLHYGHAAQVNALCVVLLALAVLPLGVAGVIGKAKRWRMAWMALGVGVLGGCSDGEPKEKVVPLDSRCFSGVQVIGGRGVSPGLFNKPRSLVCDRNDNLYVADITGRVQKFDPQGRFVLQWQMPQTDLGKPKGMGVDGAGNVLVVEPHYMRVNHFTPDGELVGQWGCRGTNAGCFILPRAIAVNSRGDVYLSEYTVVDRVQRFGPASRALAGGVPSFLGGWGAPGVESGSFNRAEGLAIGPADAVYVADSCNHRIQVFDVAGKFLRTHGQAGSNPGDFSYPYDIRVDSVGNQFVCEFGNSRITVLDARDRVLEVIGGPGSAPGRFANPWAIALDSSGNLYVADSQNHRVQKLIRRPRDNGSLSPGEGRAG